MQNERLVTILLRLGVATVFLYAAVDATVQPTNWIGYIPQIAGKIAPAPLLLMGFSLFQGILSLWIVSGRKQFLSSVIAAVTLLAIITANWGDLTILFRDFAIFFAAAALAAGSYGRR